MALSAAPLLDALICPGWRRVLAPISQAPAFAALEAYLHEERAAGHVVLPPEGQVFGALNAVAPEAVRVVILGQDPYPTPGHAHGLAFSYRGPGALPRSLGNIRRELEEDLGIEPGAASGDLGPWAAQGVLLLNTVLTVRAGEAGSHRRHGWEEVTDEILKHLSGVKRRLVFLLWGNDARRKKRLLGKRHVVLEAGHPSPLSIRYFRGCRHFSRTNEVLGDAPIDWRLG